VFNNFISKVRLKKFLIKNKKNFKSFANFKKILNHNPNKSMYDFLKINKFTNLKNNFDYNKKFDYSFDLVNHISNFYDEVYKLLFFFTKKRKLSEAKKEISKKKYIFKGTNGLGINYFIFRKN
jgi:hypothetical protein